MYWYNTITHQRKMYIFSLRMLRASTHKASWRWMLPEGPNLWNVHFVTLGNTVTIGSVRFSWSCWANWITSVPYVKNAPPRNLSIINILAIWKEPLWICSNSTDKFQYLLSHDCENYLWIKWLTSIYSIIYTI